MSPEADARSRRPEGDAEGVTSVRSRVASVVLGLIVGLVYGSVGTVAHPITIGVGPVSFPFGLVVSLIGVLALLVGFRLVLGERLAAAAAAVGVVAIVALFSLESAGGSVLIPNGVSGMAWLWGPPVIGLVVVCWPSPSERTRRLDAPEAKEFPTP